jgi:predicted nucleotidyltransferase
MPFIDSYKPQIEALCRKHKVKRLFVFGSVLTERFAAESDMDMPRDQEMSLEDWRRSGLASNGCQ